MLSYEQHLMPKIELQNFLKTFFCMCKIINPFEVFWTSVYTCSAFTPRGLWNDMNLGKVRFTRIWKILLKFTPRGLWNDMNLGKVHFTRIWKILLNLTPRGLKIDINLENARIVLLLSSLTFILTNLNIVSIYFQALQEGHFKLI